MRPHIAIAGLVFVLALPCASVQAQLAVSANDGKKPRQGDPINPKLRTPDNVTVIDLNHYPPKVLGSIDVPTSMLGPPTVVAVAHHGGFAVVSDAQTINPSNPTELIPDDVVSVIDLKDPRHPSIIQTLQATPGATGISFNKDDTLVLIAATDGTVSAFSVSGKRLTFVSKVKLDSKAQPVDVAISPDGKTALVTQRSATTVVRLSIDGNIITDTGVKIPTGNSPYGVVFNPNGQFAYNTNLGGRLASNDAQPGGPTAGRGTATRGPRIGTVTVIDLKTNSVVNTVEVGLTPEHLTLSQDGKYLEVNMGNGASYSRAGAPTFGIVQIYRVDGANLTKVAEAKTGQWSQGAAWNKDHTVLLLQSGDGRDIEVYRFDGKDLARQPATLEFKGRPGAISTSVSR